MYLFINVFHYRYTLLSAAQCLSVCPSVNTTNQLPVTSCKILTLMTCFELVKVVRISTFSAGWCQAMFCGDGFDSLSLVLLQQSTLRIWLTFLSQHRPDGWLSASRGHSVLRFAVRLNAVVKVVHSRIELHPAVWSRAPIEFAYENGLVPDGAALVLFGVAEWTRRVSLVLQSLIVDVVVVVVGGATRACLEYDDSWRI